MEAWINSSGKLLTFSCFNDCSLEFYGALEEFRLSDFCGTRFVWFPFLHYFFKVPLFFGERFCIHLTERCPFCGFIDSFSVLC